MHARRLRPLVFASVELQTAKQWSSHYRAVRVRCVVGAPCSSKVSALGWNDVFVRRPDVGAGACLTVLGPRLARAGRGVSAGCVAAVADDRWRW